MCGTEYNPDEQEPPEGATFYWVEKCPDCGAKITKSTVNQLWLNIVGDGLGDIEDKEEYERMRKKLHFQSRLYHGYLSGVTVEELVELAQIFDDEVTHGRRFGPQQERNVAFNLRRQAREKVKAQ